jgi:biopolymer transport protein ExbD
VKFRRPVEDELKLNLVPLIDCLLFLIIFFMMTTTFTKASKLQIKLPEASAQPQAAAPGKTVEVEISAAGDYAVNGQALISKQPDALRLAIDQASQGRRDVGFVIAADGQTPHQAVVTVMDVAGKLGFESLSISTQMQQPDQK